MRKFQNPACVRWVFSSFINAKFFLSTMKTSGKNFCQFVEQPPHCRSQVKGSTDWVTAAQHSNAFTSIWNLLFYCLSWAGNASEQAIYFRGALYKFSWVNEWMKCLLSHCALVKQLPFIAQILLTSCYCWKYFVIYRYPMQGKIKTAPMKVNWWALL